MKVKFIFAWYDFWVGLFFDRPKRKVYVFPLPMVGMEVQLPKSRCRNRKSMAPWMYTAQCDLKEGHDGFCVYEGEPHVPEESR